MSSISYHSWHIENRYPHHRWLSTYACRIVPMIWNYFHTSGMSGKSESYKIFMIHGLNMFYVGHIRLAQLEWILTELSPYDLETCAPASQSNRPVVDSLHQIYIAPLDHPWLNGSHWYDTPNAAGSLSLRSKAVDAGKYKFRIEQLLTICSTHTPHSPYNLCNFHTIVHM